MGQISEGASDDRLELALQALAASERRASAGQFALELIHDVRNPLEALGSLIYLALHDAERPDKVREFMELATEQMTTVREIATRTLSLAGDFRSSTDLVQLVEAALRIHQHTIESKRVFLLKHLPVDMVLPAHPGELLQVISNLIANALDALPEAGTLCLRIKKCHGEAHVVVADNGHGISKEDEPHVFQAFFTTKGEKGTGLGLALSQKIAKNHKGRLRMRSSVRTGRMGTTFRLSLPNQPCD